MIFKTKLDDSFPDDQFLTRGYHAPFRFEHNKNVGGIMLHVREDILSKLLSHDFPFTESYFVDINLYKNKWLIDCSSNPPNSNIWVILQSICS